MNNDNVVCKRNAFALSRLEGNFACIRQPRAVRREADQQAELGRIERDTPAAPPSIMIPALRHLQRLLVPRPDHPIDRPMFQADPPRPPARQVAAQRLRLAGPLERVAAAFLDQGVEPGEHFGSRAIRS